MCKKSGGPAAFVLLALFAVFSGCKKTAVPATVYELPDYRSWKKPTKIISTVDIPDHVGTFRVVYANDIAFERQEQTGSSGETMLVKKDGSIIVKETYASMADLEAQKPLFVTLMIKNTQNPLADHGWIYVKKTADEEHGKIITTRYCVGCHEGANESHPYFDGNPAEIFRDYLFLDIGGGRDSN